MQLTQKRLMISALLHNAEAEKQAKEMEYNTLKQEKAKLRNRAEYAASRTMQPQISALEEALDILGTDIESLTWQLEGIDGAMSRASPISN